VTTAVDAPRPQGLAAVFATAGLILAIVMSVVEAIWIAPAAIALARTPKICGIQDRMRSGA
jgi:hypothetical protein